MSDFGDYIIYVDESGDHGLENVNASYPVFCLAFCVFKIQDYVEKIVPAFQQLKFDYWGHDAVILHEHEITKKRDGDYSIFSKTDVREKFMGDIDGLIKAANFSIIANVQNKYDLVANADVYGLSLRSCMITLLVFLQSHGVEAQTVHLIFESRGKNEDKDLELVFRRICDGALAGTEAFQESKMKFIIKFAKKATNSTGLQMADLVARPIGLRDFKPEQTNRAYETIKEKIYLSPK